MKTIAALIVGFFTGCIFGYIYGCIDESHYIKTNTVVMTGSPSFVNYPYFGKCAKIDNIEACATGTWAARK